MKLSPQLLCDLPKGRSWCNIEVRLPQNILVSKKGRSVRNEPLGKSPETYHITGNTQDMDKRPFGPAPRAHCLVYNPSDRDHAFSNDNQRKEAHSNVEMCVLQSNTRGGARYSHYHPHLESEYCKPNGPNIGVKSAPFFEGKVHLQTVGNVSKGRCIQVMKDGNMPTPR